MRPVILVTVLALILAVSVGTATVPQRVSYQGVLRDSGGAPVADGDYSVSFSLYNAETGGTLLWSEAQTVAVEGGIFNVLLGEDTPLTLPFDAPYWLSVSVEGEPPLTPRTPFTTAPYAFHADSVEPDVVSSVDGVTNDEGNIDLIAGTNISIVPNDAANTITFSATGGGDDGDWTVSGGNVYRASGNVGVGTSSPNHRVGVHSSGDLVASAQFINDVTGSGYADGLVMGVDGLGIPYVMSYEATPGLMLGAGGTEFVRIQPTGMQIYNNTSIYGNLHVDSFDMDTGAANGYVLTADASGNGTWQPPAGGGDDGDWTISGPDVYRASGKVGIGTTSPLEELHVNGDIFVPYSGSYSVGSTSYKGLSWDAGIGAVAVGNSVTPLEFFAGSTEPIVTMDDDGTVGVGTTVPITRLHVDSDVGDAFIGQCTHTSNVDYVGVMGSSVPVDYFGIGGRFQGGWRGLEAFVAPSGNASYTGGRFDVNGGTGSNYGVFSYVDGTGANYALYGHRYGAGDYAGYFYGNVYATGTMTSGAARTKIDHPLDPANMYLNHNAVESQEMKTIYDGTVVLDAGGSAWVEMPEWFDALNAELRYQLTCVGGHAPVYVAEEVRDNRFRIAGGTSGLKVCWQVTGVRKDAFAQAHRAPVEEMKPADERGLFVHPTARGLGEEMSPEYRRHQEMERKSSASR